MSFAALSLTVLSILWRVASISPVSCGDEPVAISWYTPIIRLEDISWQKYNTVIYSFAITTQSVNNITLDGSNSTHLTQFVSLAHDKGVAAHIAIGGWGGSRFFSSNLATPENRTAFAQTVSRFAEQYSLDGVNFDWEHPNSQGIGCNTINASDTENFLSFLQELRKDPIGSQLTLSAATSITPFRDAAGNPSTNVSSFAEVLDYITLMNYDVWGSWSSTVGPNAPLNDTCAIPDNQQGSAVSAVKAWIGAGIPKNQLVLGVPAYGYSYSVSSSDAFSDSSESNLVFHPKFNSSSHPLGDINSGTDGVDVCGNKVKPSSTFMFKDFISHGFLDAYGNPASGIYYLYDGCGQTVEWPDYYRAPGSDYAFQPYVYNRTSETMVSFDNVRSFAAKGNFIKEAGLKGFAVWQTAGDYDDLLLDSIRSGAGYNDMQTRKRNWKWNL